MGSGGGFALYEEGAIESREVVFEGFGYGVHIGVVGEEGEGAAGGLGDPG